MKFEILDEQGNVANVILADPAFVQANYPGRFRRVADPAAAPRTRISRLEFLRRFTAQERKAIRQAAKSSADLEDWLELFNAAQDVNVTDADTVRGIAALEDAGVLAAGRAVQILGA